MTEISSSLKTLHELKDDQPVEVLAQAIIEHAARSRASDLFFASEENAIMVSQRQLGRMQNLRPFSTPIGKRITNHIKAMAGIDLADRHRPTEGRWIYERASDLKIDLRINSIPTIHGEDLTMRLLDRDRGMIPLEDYGFSEREYEAVTGLLRRTSGLILVTGPTGSGKSTTMYSCLQRLNDGTRKINTLEDPVEYLVKGIRQSQVNERMGVGFAELLVACLRQSPDVIMVGEIRDPRTAQVAVRAANSGHLVLATLHAPIALKAIASMVNLDVSAQAFGECLLGIISQRLVPGLCLDCRSYVDLEGAPSLFDDIRHTLPSDWQPSIYSSSGCDSCHETGYSRSICVPEILTLDNDLRAMISDGRPLREMNSVIGVHQMVTFRESALRRVALGLTTVEEVLRTIPFEDLQETLDEDWSADLAPIREEVVSV